VRYWFDEVDPSGSPTGRTYEVVRSQLITDIAPGSTVRVSGLLRDGWLLVPASVESLAPPSGGSCETGDWRVIAIVCSFQDKSAPCSTDAVRDVLFNPALTNTVRAFWTENSFGTHNYFGDVAGPFTIAWTTAKGCNESKIATLCDRAATAAGYDLARYKERIYVLPAIPGTSCAGGTSSAQGSKILRIWAYNCSHFTFAHEHGHNIGMNHAGGGGSQLDEYLDRSDVMGGSFLGAGVEDLRHNHAAHKWSTCFVPRSSPRFLDDPPDGTYTLFNLAQDPGGGTQVIRITDVAGQGFYREDYDFGFRQPTGFDSSLTLSLDHAKHLGKTNVHKFRSVQSDRQYLPFRNLLGWVKDGTTFIDFNKNFVLEQVGHDEAAATVVKRAIAGTDQDNIPPDRPPWLQGPDPGTSVSVTLNWGAAPGDELANPNGLRGYKVYRDSEELGTSPYTNFTDRRAQKCRTYEYCVRSYDDKGNLSAPLCIPVTTKCQ
jgi:hypothetical protein